MSEKPRQLMSDIMDQAVETFDMAVKNGVRMQEEASRWWSGILCATGPMQSMQREAGSAVEQARPMVEQTMEEGLRAIDRSWRSGMDLFRKVLETGQSAAMLHQKAQSLWEASVTTIRSEMQAMAEANARAIERWTEMARENTEGMAGAAAQQMQAMSRRGANGSEREQQARHQQSRGSRSRSRSRRAAAKK